MRIAILGAGHMGSWLAEVLSGEHEIAAYDRDETKARRLHYVHSLQDLSEIKAYSPDLLITDIEMPQCPGESLVRAVREDPIMKDLRILMVTAHSDPEQVARLSRWGLCGYLVKPIGPEMLQQAVQDLQVSKTT